ncbi:RraA family protein [Aquibacillus sediminis]|uniref:RraA family protein n=1 Tax=Aquibacillus sediminis TaxID=2574734 RepID=UPI001109CB85|nr:RraA family protein [Aquibacillus sediminis]
MTIDHRTMPKPFTGDIIERVEKLSTTVLSDAMGEGAMEHTMCPVSSKVNVIGTAITVRMEGGDNTYFKKAISRGKNGYVVVVDSQGDVPNAVFGEMMATAAKVAGLEGIVIDGLVRDTDVLSKIDLPVFCKGYTPKGPQKGGSGEINIAISCGEVAVNAGDLIVGDSDGVVVVPRERVEEIIVKAEMKMEDEEKHLQEIKDGFIELNW